MAEKFKTMVVLERKDKRILTKEAEKRGYSMSAMLRTMIRFFDEVNNKNTTPQPQGQVEQ